MKGIRVEEFGDPSVLNYVTDLEIPKPTGSQVLVRIKAVGINPVETYIRSGTYARKPDLPYTPGTDSAGIVESVGNTVAVLKPGQRVYTTASLTGTYAEYCLVEENHVYPLPENITFEQGACLSIPYYTAHRAIFLKGGAKPGQNIFIHGASGAVGLAACQMAAANGLKVFGTAGTEEGIKIVKQNGAIECFNHRKENYMEDLMKATGGRGFNIIVEMLANVNLVADTTVLTDDGIILIVGNRGSLEFNPRCLMPKELAIRGIALAHGSLDEKKEAAKFLDEGMRKNLLNPIVYKTFNLKDTAKAHIEVIEHSGGSKGNIVVQID
ncbi:DgyrCDS1948 [Dimorphilus gyrociliatus]|nr:DgyrCDS1948 [Dimorphilus gyrociliatus]